VKEEVVCYILQYYPSSGLERLKKTMEIARITFRGSDAKAGLSEYEVKGRITMT